MWGYVLAVNSFIVWPAAGIFVVYSLGRLVLFLEWRPLVLSIILFAIATVVEWILAILTE